MVRTNWEQIFSLNISSLTDEEIEDLCPTIMRCNIDEISDVQNLQMLMRISQEMLQYKDNQVESLLIECGELKNTISTLKPDVSKQKLKGQIVSDSQYDDKNFIKSSDTIETANHETVIQNKNEKIEKLLTELEGLDRENIILKERLGMLKEEMEDATERMNEMTDGLSSAQSKVLEYKERILDLERENIGLLNQIEELTSQQMDRDKVIDEFGVAIDSRIAEWKELLDEKDTEIHRLRENLSQSLLQSVTSVKEENKSQIVYLNEEIGNRDKIITELQSKLSEAVTEINEGAAIIEKLQASTKKPEKEEKRKEQKELLKKMQDANNQISDLQNALGQTQEDLKLKSTELCEVLSILRKYEDENHGLTEALHEIKDLKNELNHKREHIEDLVNVVNKLEMLNSYQEMEILTLREKLGISEDESISIDNIIKKRKEEEKRMEELVQENKILIDENLEMKSTIRLLKSNRSRLSAKKLDFSSDTIDNSTDFLHSTKLLETAANRVVDFESVRIYHKTDKDIRKEMKLVIDENEALRRGMHEILDSIRSQDGKSSVEVHSYTLERLLEALDVRHLAGWYHPAMRLQEHLNVIQGSNAELRSQIKQIRKELNRKDAILQDLALSKGIDLERLNTDDSDDNKLMYISEIKNIESIYQKELKEREREKESLIEDNKDLRYTIDNLNLQIDIYEKDRINLETSEDEVKRAFAIKTKDYIMVANELLLLNRKIVLLKDLLNKESIKMYDYQKNVVEKEGSLKRELTDANKRNKMLECEMIRLQSNLSNSMSITEYSDLKEKYEELNIRYRFLLEKNTNFYVDRSEIELLKDELDLTRKEKSQLMDLLKEDISKMDESDIVRQLKDYKANELIERQRADHMTKLHEISQSQLAKSESKIQEITNINCELQEKLIDVHKKLSKIVSSQSLRENNTDDIEESSNEQMEKLRVDNETLKRKLEIAEEEAKLQYTLNSFKTLELDNLRHQILDLQAISEDKATISRLNFELAGKKSTEMELNARKSQLESEISYLHDERERLMINSDKMRANVQYCRKQCDDRCRIYIDVIDFLQSQYAGSSSISALDRLTSMIEKFKTDRMELDVEMKKTKDFNNHLISQKETLTNRLEIVERLKDILEEQIGGESVQDILQKFSENSQYVLNDLKQKRRISHLDNELQMVNDKAAKYESIITSMENEMINMQKTWNRQGEQVVSRTDVQMKEIKFDTIEKRSVFVQVTIEHDSTEVQTEPYDCCLNKRKGKEEEKEEEEEVIVVVDMVDMPKEKSVREVGNNTDIMNDTISMMQLNERLADALKLAADRSEIINNYESEILDYREKIDALNKEIKAMELELSKREINNIVEPTLDIPIITNMDCTDKLALKSTINSLQKIVAQKEETIVRYQNLMKEEREEYIGVTSNLQREIDDLHYKVQLLESERKVDDKKNNDVTIEPDVDDEPKKSVTVYNAAREEEIARMIEKINTLEADLHITKELSGRWHRLAEERLKHIDRIRERLEEQHNTELEIYRSEINKWQSEADTLRQRLSEDRVVHTKGNISLMKELQEKDDKIHELNFNCQQLQNEIELLGATNRSLPARVAIDHRDELKIHDILPGTQRDQTLSQNQIDILRKQLQSLMEKEKMYKHEIAELKQRVSRGYMAVKTQEKRISQREMQLERKVKSLEEELEKMRTQLEREYLVQETRRAKTAEELSLWEKQKKWQQTAEKLQEKLKEKTNEYIKLNSNHEKLRSLVSCMEREKWFLKSKIKGEAPSNVLNDIPSRPISAAHQSLVIDLQKECQTLRERIGELERENSHELLKKIDEQKNCIASLEAVTKGNEYVVEKLQKLETTRDILERANLKLESENFELRLEIEKANADTPRLREKVEHLERYIELLKVEKSSDSTPRSSNKEHQELNSKKSVLELEKTIFTLKRIIEKLQAENKRLKFNSRRNYFVSGQVKKVNTGSEKSYEKLYEEAQKRMIDLETDLQLAEQRITMLEETQKEDDNGEINILKQQLTHKSELLEKVKQLLTRAAINEKTLRQRLQQLESKQTLSPIPECYVTVPNLD
ncbi:centrosomal protein of 290 kDa-like isoform X1 [Vespa mandarinia]|uniref:centrosomal protein of 290 kDa-like isoform X1 n=1 Tax=Vespa mandarinia TaxID=7446 RepID=UPI00160CE9B2|nr:centrosomal protein of 290 kDa-like isoform X1 [Vespa mandarinia]XP_035723609.1 centrosomal protein of 290 kDa-like isoform X1 [Vespa mandarinia]XP_035723610.1 centrosomal protein of 290 kDa-like isoform X1 [Vespa mandarinia]XP_035723611.1 centrosomal protein of 290 kDa-like isoform X1 [Vespa mandarinia]XP_035723612.1 centrosomal protein of 290 kDa-like isoform X1 [Vespa mandarinia]XP_035723614.1 centrosomal protein of 290 kDa-like isoform X1 [Vespa mandarinia]XP_035723615.1 centrosomal pr